jgi:hypothetical protein
MVATDFAQVENTIEATGTHHTEGTTAIAGLGRTAGASRTAGAGRTAAGVVPHSTDSCFVVGRNTFQKNGNRRK